MNTNERGKLESCLSGLSSVTTNLKEIIEYGIQQLRVSAIKPRINPWVDTFININHQLSEVSSLRYCSEDWNYFEQFIVNIT